MKHTIEQLALHHAQALISIQSVTPHATQAIEYCKNYLEKHLFHCHHLRFGQKADNVDNLVAIRGNTGSHLCFAGHLDTVPVGDLEAWRYPPFKATITHGKLYGRGAEDMKGNIAAFMAAVEIYLSQNPSFNHTISFLLTSDEEGPAKNGTKPTIAWMKDNNYTPDHAIVGEPTAQKRSGDTIKIGRRGSLNGKIIITGTQGHVAYPEKANNPMLAVMTLSNILMTTKLDEGSCHFSPSHLEITSIDTGNSVTNIIPEKVSIDFNIRYNDHHTSQSLEVWIKKICNDIAKNYKVKTHATCRNSGESFYAQDTHYIDIISTAIKKETQLHPKLSTDGGTSDARFIKDFCPVIEIGLPSKTMHKIDEHIEIEQLSNLSKLYLRILETYFHTIVSL